jgi:hypothetical protein
MIGTNAHRGEIVGEDMMMNALYNFGKMSNFWLNVKFFGKM